MPDEPLLTAKDVAALLNIKKSTLYEAVADGRLPAVHLWRGRRRTLLRFRRADIEAFIRERATATKPTVPEGRPHKG